MGTITFIRELEARILLLTLLGLVLSFFICSPISAQKQLEGFKIFSSDSHENVHIADLAEWEQYRWQLLQKMEEVMGPFPVFDKKVDFNIEFRDTFRADTYDRYTIAYTVAAREKEYAHLYIPHRIGLTGKSPAVLVVHPTGAAGKSRVSGEDEKPNLAIGKELAERGYVVLAPDYPGYGDLSDYDFINDRYQSGTMAGVYYHMRSVDLLTSMEYVDDDRIGVIGHSLGGHNAMFVAAFDSRLKVVVSSSGWNQYEYYDRGESVNSRYGGALGPWAQDVYMPLIRDKYDLDPYKMPFNFHEIIALIAPRAFFTNSPLSDLNFDVKGVMKGIDLVRPVYDFLNVSDKLVAKYPEAGHDFPTKTRLESYEFIDAEMDHIPNDHDIE